MLDIEKVVDGIETSQKFAFTAEIADGSDGEFLPGTDSEYTVDEDGKISFELGHGDIFHINVTPGATVTVTETGGAAFYVSYTEEGTDHLSKGPSDSFLMEEDRSITVTNTVGVSLPSTGGVGRCPVYVMGALFLAAAAVFGHTLRRRRGAGEE